MIASVDGNRYSQNGRFRAVLTKKKHNSFNVAIVPILLSPHFIRRSTIGILF